jgi:basic amino acid/polyamine antiporter, APA family
VARRPRRALAPSAQRAARPRTLNVAEEVKNPRRNLPLGLMMAMSAATLIYMAVAITAVSVVPWRELAAAPGPLTEVMGRAAPWFPQPAFVAITIFAVANTALLNYVMGSRLAYGMARRGFLPRVLGHVHPSRRTPYVAIAVLLMIVVAFKHPRGRGPRW